MEPDLLTIRRIDILIVQIITHTQKPPVIVITPDFFPSQIPVIDGPPILRSGDGRNDPLCDPFLHTQGDEGITDAEGVFSQDLSYEAGLVELLRLPVQLPEEQLIVMICLYVRSFPPITARRGPFSS